MAYSPAAIAMPAAPSRAAGGGRPDRRTETGSSSQTTPEDANASRDPLRAVATSHAPLASTISSASPIASRRDGDAALIVTGAPTFIFTRGMPCATQPPSWSRSRSSEYVQKPPEP